MDSGLIIGILCTHVAMGFNSLSSTRKTTKGVLMTQNAAQVVYATSSIILGGYSAAVQNAVSIIRNFVAIRKTGNKIVEWTLVILGVALGIWVNNLAWIGLLPVLGTLQYTLAIFRFKDDERKLKISFLISSLSFVVFNFAIRNYVGIVADTIVSITTIIMLLKKQNKKA